MIEILFIKILLMTMIMIKVVILINIFIRRDVEEAKKCIGKKFSTVVSVKYNFTPFSFTGASLS